MHHGPPEVGETVVHGILRLDVTELVDPVVHERERRDALAVRLGDSLPLALEEVAALAREEHGRLARRVGAIEVGRGHGDRCLLAVDQGPQPGELLSVTGVGLARFEGPAGVEAAIGCRSQHGQVGHGCEADRGEARLA